MPNSSQTKHAPVMCTEVHSILDLPNQSKSGFSALSRTLWASCFHLPSLAHALNNRCPEGIRAPNLPWKRQTLYSHQSTGHARRLSFSGPVCRQWEAELLHREIPGKKSHQMKSLSNAQELMESVSLPASWG